MAKVTGSSFMINYRADVMDGILAHLKRNGVAIVKGRVGGEREVRVAPGSRRDKVELWELMPWTQTM